MEERVDTPCPPCAAPPGRALTALLTLLQQKLLLLLLVVGHSLLVRACPKLLHVLVRTGLNCIAVIRRVELLQVAVAHVEGQCCWLGRRLRRFHCNCNPTLSRETRGPVTPTSRNAIMPSQHNMRKVGQFSLVRPARRWQRALERAPDDGRVGHAQHAAAWWSRGGLPLGRSTRRPEWA